ncbi:hypothetical protein FHP25_32545 [Vineibacter terrae]|uniref:Uncharacterized protein n=1 Tax=Vineibacter terrae TaxID=2586908 RepID=A0A5C8PAN8_9HYPH|nr:hypothetical protein [Vineibacter terrae]TXL70852.1 hypothetical protein FHP25_32545 [Vineibacter terrae]
MDWRKGGPKEANISTREWLAREITDVERLIEHQEVTLADQHRQLARLRLIRDALDKTDPESTAELDRRL